MSNKLLDLADLELKKIVPLKMITYNIIDLDKKEIYLNNLHVCLVWTGSTHLRSVRGIPTPLTHQLYLKIIFIPIFVVVIEQWTMSAKEWGVVKAVPQLLWVFFPCFPALYSETN